MCPGKVTLRISSRVGKTAQSPASLKPGLRKGELWIPGEVP